jgi:hydrogenase maturation protease
VQPQILVLGLGNILLQDEGMGVTALERLTAQYRLPANVHAVDGGTMGLDLLSYLEGVTGLLIIDAVHTGQPPGTLVRLAGDEVPAALSLKMSMHQVGLQELLAVSELQGILPPRVVVCGMEPASLDWGLDLSPQVAGRLDDLVQAVVQELQDWGMMVIDRASQLAQLDSLCFPAVCLDLLDK